jgi:hypothetical protein
MTGKGQEEIFDIGHRANLILLLNLSNIYAPGLPDLITLFKPLRELNKVIRFSFDSYSFVTKVCRRE